MSWSTDRYVETPGWRKMDTGVYPHPAAARKHICIIVVVKCNVSCMYRVYVNSRRRKAVCTSSTLHIISMSAIDDGQ